MKMILVAKISKAYNSSMDPNHDEMKTFMHQEEEDDDITTSTTEDVYAKAKRKKDRALKA